MLYIYGILFSLISIVFYIRDLANQSIYDSNIKALFKFVYSLSVAWIFVFIMDGSFSSVKVDIVWIAIIVVYIFPLLAFLGFQLHLYGVFNRDA